MKKLLFLLLLSSSTFLMAQPWLQNMPQNKSSEEWSLYDFENAFHQYWEPYQVNNKGYYLEDGKKVKAPGWKQFYRWYYQMEAKVDPSSGSFPSKTAQQVYDEFIEANPKHKSTNSANWTNLGPNSSTGGYAGVGRLNCIAFHPTDNNTYWVGAPAGGLWKTTNNGSSWTCLTDENNVLGVSDIIIPTDYSSSQTIYIATGDRDAWDNRSIGVLKSTNGGSSWNSTGIQFDLSDGDMVTRLLLHPSDNQTIIAATSNGVYKTTNGGSTWNNQLTSTSFIDMEYKPGDFNTLYGSTTSGSIYRSINGGNNWTEELSQGNRIELAVSEDEPTYVYAIIANSSSALDGIYKSTNSGNSFSEIFSGNSSNLLGWDSNGGGSQGQGWYDLSIAVSPNDANTLLVGGINTWRSTNGGSSWSIVNHWWGDGVPAVHADKHMLKYRDNGDLFECNDGGVYLSTNNGTSWIDKTNGMIISQMYKLGVSQTNATETITGLQDNGSKLFFSNFWTDVKSGDGMECLIDYTSSNIQYATYVNGQITRTTNHWVSSTDIEPSAAGDGAWVTPYIIDPVDHNTLYAGYTDIWKTTNKGDNWTKISSMNTPSKIRAMAIAPSDNDVLYVSDPNEIWKTTNGGSSWTEVTSNLPTNSSSITYIAIKADNPNTLWVSLSGYNSNLVYESTNGGSTWDNISDGLPSIPAYTIVQNTQAVSTVHLYIGTELGVYFKDGNNNWVEYNTNLPKVQCGELEIYYAGNTADSKLRLASYGRGLWESPLIIENTDLPSVQTTAPTNITQTTATLGGHVINQGTSNISERGVVYSTSPNPTTSDFKIINANTGTGNYTASASGLSSTTTYYVKAYAINSYGTAYGGQESFTTDCAIFSLPFAEGFESSTFPPNCWDSYRGSNGVGAAQDWESSDDAFSGSQAAHVVWEDTEALLAEDWLVSPKILISSGAEMTFYQKQEYETEYGSMYYIKVSTSSQTNITSFSTLASWGESSFSVAYSEKTIDLSAYAGQEIYIAFVMTNDNGDDWFVDDINIEGSAPTPIATVSAIPDCNTGTIKVMSSLSGNQTFYLTDNSGAVLDNASANASFYNFTGLSDGVYKGKVEKEGQMSALSSAVTLTNNTTPEQPSNMAGNLSPCQGTSQTYSITNDPEVDAYNWTLPSTWTGSSTSSTITVVVGNTDGNISVIPENDCGNGIPRTLTVGVNELPSQPSIISGETAPCEGNSITYTVDNNPNVLSYVWSLPNGWSGNSNTNSITVSVGTIGGNISVMPTNDCGNGDERTLAVVVNELPAQPSIISGESAPCEGNSITYTVDNDPNVLSYDWSLPSGWSGNSNTYSITVIIGSMGGNIIVSPINDCGNGPSRSLTVEVNTIPAQPSIISGNEAPCVGESITYSITNDPNADSYIWSLPNGWTGSSTTNEITVSVGNEDGIISAIPVNICGNGEPRELNVEAIAIPSQVSAIDGNASVCEGTQELYTVELDDNIVDYSWSIPSGWTGTSTTNEITVTIGANGGNMSVIPNNECGSGPSLAISLEVTNEGPAQPDPIEGDFIACVGSTEVYSVPFDPSVDTYEWTLPSGWTGTSNTNSISVTVGSNGGEISVTPSNFCGEGTAQSATVDVTTSSPDQPSAISGTQEICSGETETYSVDNVNGVEYNWELPSDWIGSSTSSEIEVIIGNSSGDIIVTPSNGCGDGPSNSLTVEVNQAPLQASEIFGEEEVCAGATEVYSVDEQSGVTYNWSLPSGWTGTSISHEIAVIVGTDNGEISVVLENECGLSPASSKEVNSNPILNQLSNISGLDEIWGMDTETYSVEILEGAESYNWTLDPSWILTTSNGSNEITIDFPEDANPGMLSVIAENFCGLSEASEMFIEIIPIGVSEISMMDVEIYPNPAQDMIYIEINKKLEADTDITLWTLNGSKVITDKMKSDSQKLELDLSSLASGSYILELKNRTNTEKHKIVINK